MSDNSSASRLTRLLFILRRAIRHTAYATLALIIWIAAGLPISVDRWLDVSEGPIGADVIVCLAGGITSFNTPLEAGWDRTYTAAQLFADGFAPFVIFSGRGSGTMSESEIYRDAAVWIGLPRSATVGESNAQSTAEHPRRLLGLVLPDGRRVSRDSRLLVVTSDYHGRRALMTFQKAGFRHVRVVASYRSTTSGRHQLPSADVGYSPSGKSYSNPVRRFVDRSNRMMSVASELVAIVVYRFRGLV